MTGIGGISLVSNCNGDAAKPASCTINAGPIKIGTASYGGIKLPQPKGQVKLPKIVSVQLPTGLPSFALKTITTLTVTDSDGAQAFCVKITTAPKDAESETPVTPMEDEYTEQAAVSASKAKCSGAGTLPGDGPFCYHAKIGMLGVTETIDVKITRTSSNSDGTENGKMDLIGGGISPFKCVGVDVVKNGQDCNPDAGQLKKCLPRGVTVTSAKYCSDSDQVQVTIKDSNVKILPSITGTASKVKCGGTTNKFEDPSEPAIAWEVVPRVGCLQAGKCCLDCRGDCCSHEWHTTLKCGGLHRCD
jgi:hypothetical protein